MADKDLLERMFATPAGSPVRVSDIPAAPRRVESQTALVRGAQAWRALVFIVRALAVLLVVLSVLGTFYGARGLATPLLNPAALFSDLWNAPQLLALSILGQGLLSVLQWGSRWGAMNRNRGWWLLYFFSLALSVWWNWQAYGATMTITMHMPWLLALGVVIGSDVLPEFTLVAD